MLNSLGKISYKREHAFDVVQKHYLEVKNVTDRDIWEGFWSEWNIEIKSLVFCRKFTILAKQNKSILIWKHNTQNTQSAIVY